VDAYLPKSFSDLIRRSEIPVLVDFWAEWCGACKMAAPVMKEIASVYKGKLVVIKVNVDQKPDIAAQYQISGIPTIMMFSMGKIVMRHSGALPFQAMKSEIDKHLQ
jgi:thioredoxin 1